MSARSKIKAYSLIVELLMSRKEIHFQEIKKYLENNDYRCADRTIERYIEHLRVDFGVISDCDRRTNLYSLNEENRVELDRLMRLIHLVNSSELLLDSIRNKDKTLSCFSFEMNEYYAGSVNLEPVYRAIARSCEISFDHENFDRGEIRRRTLQPYLLKEYANRWYVVGTLADSGEVRTYGLDRISRIEVSDRKFVPAKREHIFRLFAHLIGLVYDMDKPATVRISVTPGQAKYFRKAPLHASQTVESENEREVIFSYWLIPNRELLRLILGYGSQIKVLEPEWFVTQVRERIREMAELYEKKM
jgi:predicted DNA-binding transcriptional regulator YafY